MKWITVKTFGIFHMDTEDWKCTWCLNCKWVMAPGAASLPFPRLKGLFAQMLVLFEGQTTVSRCLQTWWPGKWWLQFFHTYEMHACSSTTKLRRKESDKITHHIIRRNGISVLSSSKLRQETSAFKTAQKLVNYVNACGWHSLCVYCIFSIVL